MMPQHRCADRSKICPTQTHTAKAVLNRPEFGAIHSVGAVAGIKPERADQIIDNELSAGLAYWLTFAQDVGMDEQEAQTIMNKQQ